MNIATVRSKLRKGKVGRFRMLKVGEVIQEHDIVVSEWTYDWVVESSIGSNANSEDTLIRLEFDK